MVFQHLFAFFTFSENAGDPRQQYEAFLCQHAEKPLGKFGCSYCPYSCDNSGHPASTVTMLKRTHTDEGLFVCQLCQKAFTEEGNLQSHHKAVHAKERPYECEVCGQHFTRASNLSQHRRVVHTRDGPSFTCPECGKGFSHKGNLGKHLLTHTGERPHACATCGKRFRDVSNMKRHMMEVHNMK